MPKLQVYLPDDSQQVHDLTEDKITVGRLPDNDLQIDEGSVSSHHAELVLENDSYHLHDIGSTNGTFVNDEQVSDAILHSGDQVRFGSIEAVFAGDDAVAGDQPMPEASQLEVQSTAASSRPANFVAASPVPKPEEKKSPLGLVALVLAIVALIGMGGVTALVLQMQPPV